MNIDLHGNIPRLCTAFADWMACMLYLYQMKRRLKGIRLGLVSAAFLAVQMSFMQLTDGYNGVLFNLFMALSAFLMMLFMLGCSNASFWTTGYFCARAFLLAGLASSLSWQVYRYLENMYPQMYHIAPMICCNLLLDGAVFAVMFWLEGKHREENMSLQVHAGEMVSTIVLTVGIYILSSISYAPVRTPFGGVTDAEVYNLRTLVYFAGAAILFASHLQICELYMRRERDAMHHIFLMQYANYQMSQESIELVNQKYHDLKHHIAVLRAQDDTNRKMEYLDRMEQEIKAYEAQNKTGNKVLDTVLTAKSIHCQKRRIQLTSVADGTALGFMDVMDISTLFGNALDNAIESVDKIEKPQKRLIHLSVARQKQFLRIRVENCYEGEIQMEDGIPSTTKDKRYHGYGLKSIKNTARKYGGSVTISTKNGWFELRILMPLPKAYQEPDRKESEDETDTPHLHTDKQLL